MKKNRKAERTSAAICIGFAMIALVVFASCATTGKGGRSTGTQSWGNSSGSTGSTYDNGYNGYTNTGSQSEKPWNFNLFGFKDFKLPQIKLPFDLNTFNIGKVTFKEEEIYAGTFGIMFLGTYIGLVLRKIWKRK
jgi:hypothetical protein